MIRSVLCALTISLASTALAADTTSVVGESAGPRLRALPPLAYGTRLPGWSFGVRGPTPFTAAPPDTTAPATISLKTYRPLPMDDLFRPQRIELTRFDCAIKGVGAGMRAGLFAGLLAKELGAFGSERVPWYMAGAGAAAGALLGGTLGAESSRWNVGYRWEPSPELGP